MGSLPLFLVPGIWIPGWENYPRIFPEEPFFLLGYSPWYTSPAVREPFFEWLARRAFRFVPCSLFVLARGHDPIDLSGVRFHGCSQESQDAYP